MSEEQIEKMVSRFLTWELPQNFNPDGGIEFTPPCNPVHFWPIGTNLLNAEQAREMIRHLLAGDHEDAGNDQQR